MGMIDCSSTWLSQDLPYAQAKIKENKWNRYKHNKYNNIDIPNTKRAIPLYGIANFNLPTIKTAIEVGQLQSGSLVHMLYSHEIFKLSRVSVCDCASDFRCNFKTRSRFWRLPEWITNFQLLYFVSSNFYWPHILKGKAGEMHLQNHLLERRRFSRFSDGIWHETWFGKWQNCIAPLSCCCESPKVYNEFAVHSGKSTKILIQKRDG